MKPKLNRLMILVVSVLITAASSTLRADTGNCGGASTALPFTDVAAGNIFFCSIAEAFFSGLTNGTTPTTYSPSANVPREQMAAFITRTMDQSLKRGSRRAALNQYWTTQGPNNLGLTTVGQLPEGVASDGEDLWVAGNNNGTISQVHASNGKPLGTWTGAAGANRVLCAMGKVFAIGSQGVLFQLDPSQPPGSVTVVSSSLGLARGIAYDGQRIWVSCSDGLVSIVALNPTSVTNVGGFASPKGIVFDGANIWITDTNPGDTGKLIKLDSSGSILQSVDVGIAPYFPAFDGTNIWVPNDISNTVTVVRATGSFAGTVLATLAGNGLADPIEAAFDGERILVTDYLGDRVSLWKAADLTPIGTFSTGTTTHPYGVCSDGLNFWITFYLANKLVRF